MWWVEEIQHTVGTKGTSYWYWHEDRSTSGEPKYKRVWCCGFVRSKALFLFFYVTCPFSLDLYGTDFIFVASSSATSVPNRSAQKIIKMKCVLQGKKEKQWFCLAKTSEQRAVGGQMDNAKHASIQPKTREIVVASVATWRWRNHHR